MLTYGVWAVSTEGDCEGTSAPKDLGIHEGYIDEIAFALADKAMHELYFKKGEYPPPLDMTPKKKAVAVNLVGAFPELNLSDSALRAEVAQELFTREGRDVKVERSGSYRGIILKTNAPTIDEERAALIESLTPRQRMLLGLE